MKTIIVSQAVIDMIDALFSDHPELLIREARPVAGGWKLDVTDDVFRRILAYQREDESIADVVLRVLQQSGIPGMRRAIHRVDRRRARQQDSRRRTGRQ